MSLFDIQSTFFQGIMDKIQILLLIIIFGPWWILVEIPVDLGT